MTSPRPINRTSRSLLAALVVAGLATTSCGLVRSEVAEAPQPPAIDEPAPDGPLPVEEGGGVDDEGATFVEPHPEAQGSQPVMWDKVSFDRETLGLTVYWTSGVEPCTVLDEIVVEVRDADVLVTVMEGAPPEAAAISCIMMAQTKRHTVTLDEDPGDRPFVDGAR